MEPIVTQKCAPVCRWLLEWRPSTVFKDTDMAAFLIVDTDLTHPERYEDYKRQAKPLAEQYGGEYLVRGGAMTLKENDLWSPTRMVVVRFASMEKAQAFYDSAEYQRILGISRESARRTVVLVEGF